jgi:CHAT domain-containing protein
VPGPGLESDRLGVAAGKASSVWRQLEIPLQLVSFAALPEGADRYLVERGPVVHYLSAERDLVFTALPQGTGLLAAGAPSFDERSPAVPERPAGAQDRRPATTVASAVFRGALPSCRNFDSLRFAALPSAGLEIEDVADAWKTSTKRLRGPTTFEAFGAEPLLLSGPAASETAVKASAPGRRIVHLATHGFFLGDCPSAPGSEAARPIRSATVFADNPLLLSGLALAGANQRGTAAPGAEDGILTAEEIAALDLSGVEWAVLSACETGVGELRTGEGLFGLRRAFQIAGARSLILSLWPVEDEASRQWMKTLYRNRLARGMTTAKAVHEASREELLKRRAAGLSTHPFYWAGFVAAGDWR